MQKILACGAEAVIYKKDYSVTKKRIRKSYRISEIDEKIRKLRTRGEAKLIERASKVVNVPAISKVSENSKEIKMEFINGKKLSEHLNNFDLKEQKKIAGEIGKDVSLMHDANVIHGDLTTSNLIWVEAIPNVVCREERHENLRSRSRKILEKDFYNGQIYFIDFGLGFYSTKIEDRAVDLYLLRQALEAKHFENFKVLFKEILKSYKSKDRDKVLERLKKVENRRRYKH